MFEIDQRVLRSDVRDLSDVQDRSDVRDRSDICSFLPPIRGLSVVTGEKTTMPIWKICRDNMIVSPGYQGT